MRYFLHLAYNGKDYHGWQRQPSSVSIQEKIENGLSILLKKKTDIVGAGRTDAGVNARMMVAHFDCEIPIFDEGHFIASLNGIVDPMNIVFYSVKSVPDNAHARFDAIERTYRYYVHTKRSPFLFPYSLQVNKELDFEQMNQAAEILLENKDFTSFAKLHGNSTSNICNVTNAKWVCMDTLDLTYYFEITANRFLRNMVRAITGTLIDVGRHKINIDDFQDIINKKNRCNAGTSVPPSPLFLHEIKYPFWIPKE